MENFSEIEAIVLSIIGGYDRNGNKKPKTCWDFVHNNKCKHTNKYNKLGKSISNFWHPGLEEKKYLKNKNILYG